MLKCPECSGYGKTISTRNFDNAVIRWHKCQSCGYTFTSTQKVNCIPIKRRIRNKSSTDIINVI